jgi:hypothetical protein
VEFGNILIYEIVVLLLGIEVALTKKLPAVDGAKRGLLKPMKRPLEQRTHAG